MTRLVTLLLSLCLVALGQTGLTVNLSGGPPNDNWTTLYFYSGSNLEYACMARSVQPTATFSVGASTLTSIVVATNVGTATTPSNHGLVVGNQVVVSGATVDTDLNSTYVIQTVPTATTFTITTASVADGTYNESTLQFTTTAPRTTQAIFSVKKYFYDGSSNLIRIAWASGVSAVTHACDDRASLSYQ